MKPLAELMAAGLMMASAAFYFSFFIGIGLGAAYAVVRYMFNL